MNRLEYTLSAEDLLQFNLYYASTSKAVARQKRIYRYVIPAIYLALALFLFIGRSHVLAWMFVLLSVLWFLFYPLRFRRRYRKHYERYVAEAFGDVLPRATTLELLPDGIFSSSHMGESTFRYEMVGRIVENEGYTYIFIGKGMALVLPHDRIPEESIKGFVKGIESRTATQDPKPDTGSIQGGDNATTTP